MLEMLCCDALCYSTPHSANTSADQNEPKTCSEGGFARSGICAEKGRDSIPDIL